jgi:siroheme synthase-like protein
MAFFPFFVDLAGKPGLIVGGGTIALHKIKKLLPYGPSLTVVAPEILPEITSLPNVTCLARAFREEDLDDFPAFVVAGTDDHPLNHRISALCQARSIPVNVVDEPELCTFVFPALVQRGPLSVGISTSGTSPTAAIWVKEQLQDLIPDCMEDLLDWLYQLRPQLRPILPRERDRAKALKVLFQAALLQGRPLDQQEITDCLKEAGFSIRSA